jgi:L-aspartate oxidase
VTTDPLSLPDHLDILVIGSGAAGLYTSLCLPPQLQVGLVTKSRLPKSASDWAQGGIAAAIDPDDAPAFHVADTIAAGVGLCDLEAVRVLAESAADCVRSLVDLGVGFDRIGDRLALTLEAAHSHRRVLHAADTTGRAVVSTLSDRVRQRENIQILDDAFVVDLWIDPDGERCLGAVIIRDGVLKWMRAGAVVLATGGGGQVFAKTTNPSVSTGDGVAMAWRSGAILRDLEFFQFHPTALAKENAPSFLISEAVRGEGAHLVDDAGRRFTFDDHPSGELAPRDVVSRSIYRYLNATADDPAEAHVWLDLSPIGPDRIRARFPNIIRKCQNWGIDVIQERIPVSPAAHYWMGGIQTDLTGQTSIAGLYAVGETASTGVHGANRLASNSLLECLVFGSKLANIEVWQAAIADRGHTAAPSVDPVQPWTTIPPSEWDWIANLRSELPRLLWKNAGICREATTLAPAITQVEQWRQHWNTLHATQLLTTTPPGSTRSLLVPESSSDDLSLCMNRVELWGETRNLLDIGELILKSALFRQESRGGHYRSDFPATTSDWRVHTLISGSKVWRSSPIEVRV